MQMISNLIIRPNRDKYDISELHPPTFTLNKRKYARTDLLLPGPRGSLVCSWYRCSSSTSDSCIIYLHGNSGSRVDSEEILELVLRSGISLFCFDFSGCGMSEGETISLGYYEKDDISAVIKYIYSVQPKVNLILWGRSMGAVASILYAQDNPFIVARVLDSPFADFNQVVYEMVADYKLLPRFLSSFILDLTAKHIKQQTNFDIRQLIPKNSIKNCRVPTIFIHSGEDALVKIEHSREMYALFKGPKCFMEITGQHNTVRDRLVIMKALKIVQFLIVRSQRDEKEQMTVREHLPAFGPATAEILRHRRGFSQGNNV